MATLVSRIADLAASVRDKINLKANLSDTVVVITGATHTLSAANNGKLHEYTNAGGCVVTAPNTLPAGWNSLHAQMAAGKVSFQAASGATLHGYGNLETPGLYSEVSLRVRSNADGATAVYNLGGGDGGGSSGGSAPDWPAAIVSKTTSQGIDNFSWTRLMMNVETFDSHNAYDLAASRFIVPAGQAGIYEMIAKVRFDDGAGDFSYGLGMDDMTAHQDTPDFLWAKGIGSGGTDRFGHLNIRRAALAAGDAIDAYVFQTSGAGKTVIAASFSIARVK